MRITKTKIALVGATTAVVALAGSAAYAYFTSTGSGTATTSTGSATGWGVVVSPITGTMYPGSAALPVSITVTNGGSGHQQLNAVALTVSTLPSGCVAADFTPTSPTVTATDFAPGDSHTYAGSIVMNNTSANQNPCASKTPTLTAAAS